MARALLSLLLLTALACGAQTDPRVDALEKELEQVKRRLDALEHPRPRPAAAAPTGGAGLYSQGQELEAQGKSREAVKTYTQAARSGNGKAALRLSEIYDKGLIGVSRDYAESLKWCNAARVLGEDVTLCRPR